MSMTFLSWLAAVYTFVLFGVQFAEFWTDGAIRWDTTLPNGIYLMLLSAYVGTKEYRRWTSDELPRSPGRRVQDRPGWRLPGEFFVGLWAIFLLVAWFFSEMRPQEFAYPGGLTLIAFEVLGFYIGSSASKWMAHLRDDEEQAEVEASLTPAPDAQPAAPAAPRIQKKRARYEESILHKAGSQGYITREDAQGVTGLGQTAAWKLLEDLERRGKLRQEGGKGDRSSRYVPV